MGTSPCGGDYIAFFIIGFFIMDFLPIDFFIMDFLPVDFIMGFFAMEPLFIIGAEDVLAVGAWAKAAGTISEAARAVAATLAINFME